MFYGFCFFFAAKITVSKLIIKWLKWPPTETDIFSADVKGSIELNMTPSALSLECPLKNIKEPTVLNRSDVELPIYLYDGFKVMPLLHKEDFAFCLSQLQTTYFDHVNYVDMNWLYIVESHNIHLPPLKKRQKQTTITLSSETEIVPRVDRKFALRATKEFSHVQLLPGNKFRCQCKKTCP